MRFNIDIDYPLEKMALNRQRMQARLDFRYVDRAPVGFCVVPRYFAPHFGLRYKDFFSDVETQYYWQLQFAKYRIENIPEDVLCHEPVITVYPYFDNVLNASAFGAQVHWPENETLQTTPTIHSVEEMERMEVPAPGAGLWGRVHEWWAQMHELARDTHVTFNGVEGRVEVGALSIGGEGPHMNAVDVVGHDFYWWMLEYPEQCHAFLTKITQGMIQAEQYYRRVDPRPRGAYGIAEDTAQILSPKQFDEFVAPYDKMLFDTLGAGMRDGRGMHMCGTSLHLHKALVENERISSFNVFGYQVPLDKAAHNMGGRVYLWGNINPMLMLNGTRQEVKEAALQCLRMLAPCGGFTLGDGANVCPGTPLENLAVLTEAAEEFGIQAGMQPICKN
jgi:uroporphyrinogen-III decarboxylase